MPEAVEGSEEEEDVFSNITNTLFESEGENTFLGTQERLIKTPNRGYRISHYEIYFDEVNIKGLEEAPERGSRKAS